MGPRIQDVAAVAVQAEKQRELLDPHASQIPESSRLGLGEALGPAVDFGTGVAAGAGGAPRLGPVAVEVDALALRLGRVAPVLAPQPVVGVRELVAVGVGHRHEDHGHVLQELLPGVGQFLRQERRHRRGQPLPSVGACGEEGGRLVARPDGPKG